MPVTASWFGTQLKMQYDGTPNGVVDFDADDIRTALATSASSLTAATALDTFDFFDDVTGEVSGAGYTTLGYDHATRTVTLDTGTDEVRLDLEDAEWTSASFTGRYAIIYKNTGTASTSPVMGRVDFGGDETVSSGTFTITWDSTGALKIDYT